MFNRDFYPTPAEFAKDSLLGFCKKVQSVLEPSAGKGDLAFAVAERIRNDAGYYGEVFIKNMDIDCIEIEPELRSILKGKGLRVVYDDFLRFHTYKHYDLICMNPPFSEGAKHLLKALEIQQQSGGKIFCLLNAETIKNPCNNERKDLLRKLSEVNADIQYKQNVFSTAEAERKTNVEIAVIKIDIPQKNFSTTLFDSLQKPSTEVEQNAFENESNRFQIACTDIVKNAVMLYEREARAGLKLISEFRAMKDMLLPTFPDKEKDKYKSEWDKHSILELIVDNKSVSIKNMENVFLSNLRMKYWRELFSNPIFMGKLTSNLQSEYNAHIEKLGDYDFSLYNIYTIQVEMTQKMVKGVEDTIVKLFDELSHKHYWDKRTSSNIHYYNGWATNSAYKVNKKVIVPIDAFTFYGRFEPSRWDVVQQVGDIEKVFEYLDGGRTSELDLRNALKLAKESATERNIDLKYFKISFFKKGTAHITFKDEELLKKFNIFGSQQKNWLPPSYGKKAYQDMSAEEKAVIDEFEGSVSYDNTMNNRDFYILESGKLLLLAN